MCGIKLLFLLLDTIIKYLKNEYVSHDQNTSHFRQLFVVVIEFSFSQVHDQTSRILFYLNNLNLQSIGEKRQSSMDQEVTHERKWQRN